jgi:fucose 4-O-acetylase-like acetyltransferase
MSTTALDARSLAAATPDTRDRYIDLLRLASIAVVVLGHWMMAVLRTDPDGTVHAGNSLEAMTWLQPLTWVLQVVPVFFFCGGAAHAHVLRRGPCYGDFVASRARRLLSPMLAFLVAWSLAAVALEVGHLDGGAMAVALRVVTQPLWFLGVYLGVVLVAPAMHRLHLRHGWMVLTVLAAMTLAVDALRFATGSVVIGALNVAVVWLGVHQLGFAYADGSLDRAAGRRLALGGGVALAALLCAGPYPLSMVGMPGEAISNMNPPTAALAAQATCLIGMTVLARAALTRWLQRPRVWLAVVAGNGVVMTVFLWHLTALFAVELAGRALGLVGPAVGSPSWWAWLPVRMALAAALTAALVAAARGFELPRPAAAAPANAAVAAIGGAAAVAGTLVLSATGLGAIVAGREGEILGIGVTAVDGLVLLGVGSSLLSLCRRCPLEPTPQAPIVRPWTSS